MLQIFISIIISPVPVVYSPRFIYIKFITWKNIDTYRYYRHFWLTYRYISIQKKIDICHHESWWIAKHVLKAPPWLAGRRKSHSKFEPAVLQALKMGPFLEPLVHENSSRSPLITLRWFRPRGHHSGVVLSFAVLPQSTGHWGIVDGPQKINNDFDRRPCAHLCGADPGVVRKPHHTPVPDDSELVLGNPQRPLDSFFQTLTSN